MATWVQVTVLLLWVPALAVVRALGRAALARRAEFRLLALGLGRGKPIVRYRTATDLVLFVGRWFFLGVTTCAVPAGLGRGPRAALFHAGGLAAQAALGIVLAVLPAWWWVGPVSQLNALVAFVCLVPWRVAGRASDGWWLLATLSPPRVPASTHFYATRPMVERAIRTARDVGSPLATWYATLQEAWIDVLVGQDADAYFAGESAPPTRDVALEVLATYVRAQWHHSHGRPLAALQEIRETRRVHGSALQGEANDLLALAEAQTWLAVEEPRAARQVLAQLAGTGGIVGQQAAALALRASVGDDDIDGVEIAGRRLAARLRGPFLDAPDAVIALWAAAQRLQAEQRMDASADLAHASRAAAARVLAAVAEDDRPTLVRRLGEPAGMRGDPYPAGVEGPLDRVT